MDPAQGLGQRFIDHDDDVDGKESRAAGWRLTESGLHGGRHIDSVDSIAVSVFVIIGWVGQILYQKPRSK